MKTRMTMYKEAARVNTWFVVPSVSVLHRGTSSTHWLSELSGEGTAAQTLNRLQVIYTVLKCVLLHVKQSRVFKYLLVFLILSQARRTWHNCTCKHDVHIKGTSPQELA